MKTASPESAVKKKICEYLDTFSKHKLMFWVQSAGKIPGRIGKSKYQRNGIPDICAVYKGLSVFFEVKYENGELSDAQNEFFYDCQLAGGYCFRVNSVDQVITAIEYLDVVSSTALVDR